MTAVFILFLTAPKAGAVIIDELLSYCTFTKSLYLGVSDPQVKCLQQYLNAAGYTVSVSGAGSPGKESAYFGAKTKVAVAEWQAANSVSPAAGYFGAISRAKYLALKSAVTGAATTGLVVTPATQ